MYLFYHSMLCSGIDGNFYWSTIYKTERMITTEKIIETLTAVVFVLVFILFIYNMFISI